MIFFTHILPTRTTNFQSSQITLLFTKVQQAFVQQTQLKQSGFESCAEFFRVFAIEFAEALMEIGRVGDPE